MAAQAAPLSRGSKLLLAPLDLPAGGSARVSISHNEELQRDALRAVLRNPRCIAWHAVIREETQP